MQKRTNSELLEIITTLRDSYNAEAVIAAERELESRKLTAEQLDQARKELQIKADDKIRRDEETEAVRLTALEAIDTINPLKTKSTKTTIKLVSAGLAISFFYFVSSNYDFFIYMMHDSYDLSVISLYGILTVFAVGIFGFVKIKKYGWIIITALMTSNVTIILLSVISEVFSFMNSKEEIINDSLSEIEMYDYSISDNSLDISSQIWQLIVLGALLFFLNRKNLVSEFKINKRTQWLTPVFSVVALFIMVFILITS